MAQREGDRKQIIKELTEAVTKTVLSMEDGGEATIAGTCRYVVRKPGRYVFHRRGRSVRCAGKSDQTAQGQTRAGFQRT